MGKKNFKKSILTEADKQEIINKYITKPEATMKKLGDRYNVPTTDIFYIVNSTDAGRAAVEKKKRRPKK